MLAVFEVLGLGVEGWGGGGGGWLDWLAWERVRKWFVS